MNTFFTFPPKGWRPINNAVVHAAGARYQEAVQLLEELHAAAIIYQEEDEFNTRFRTWVQAYTRRPALVERLRKAGFTW